MEPFRFHHPTVLYYGPEQLEANLSREVMQYGDTVLLVYGRGSLKSTGQYERVINILSAAGIRVVELADIESNPSVRDVRRGIETCKREQVNLVLGIGGGSVIDTAKSIAAGVTSETDVWAFFTGHSRVDGALPIGVIVTHAGTGSEMNPIAVLSNKDTGQKQMIYSEHLYPKFSFCDPSITRTSPVHQTVYGIVDMFTHVCENYFTRTENAPVQKRFAEALMRTIQENAYFVLEDPSNYQARETLMYCSTMALSGFVHMGVRGDWSTHIICDELAGFYDVPHGALLAIVLPHWMEHVVSNAVERFADMATEVFGVGVGGGSESSTLATATSGISAVREFFRSIGGPSRLSELHIERQIFETVCERIQRYGQIGAIQKLDREDIMNILQNAY